MSSDALRANAISAEVRILAAVAGPAISGTRAARTIYGAICPATSSAVMTFFDTASGNVLLRIGSIVRSVT